MLKFEALKDILLITPPFTQLNTPYPATAYLKGFLNKKNISSYQLDLGIMVVLKMFRGDSVSKMFKQAEGALSGASDNSRRIYALRERYIQTVDSVVLFLQGKNPNFARQICSPNFLPRASRFDHLGDLEFAYGNMGIQDQAKFLGTMYLEDLSDFIVECLDEHFGFSRYAERLGMSANKFDELLECLTGKFTYIDEIMLSILGDEVKNHQPKLVCFSVPFPGNLYAAFRCAQFIKKQYPSIKIAMGGGFPNTELRSLKEPRVFDFFDYITLDDGELPVELLYSNISDPTSTNPDYGFFKRTFLIENGVVVFNDFSLKRDYRQTEVGTPDYTDLQLNDYISVIEVSNPMHSLWSDGRWNKLTMAHGCYWGKCTFCDVSLDYIGNYQPMTASLLVDRMEEIISKTGESGFHFVDEAAPPKLMRDLAIEILRRGLVVTWWTNIRFEKSFSSDLCQLLKASGCIAVSGGLEVASDRLLDLIKKGVSVEQVAQVTKNFTVSGIMVHSYLMYGYPTQTIQETVDSLEMVRQLFEEGVIQSGFWHQFALTAHSPIGLDPESFGLEVDEPEVMFAVNDLEFKDLTQIDHSMFSEGLKKSLFNYLHGMCFDFELQEWFDFPIPETTVSSTYIQQALAENKMVNTKDNSIVLYLGCLPIMLEEEDGILLEFHSNEETFVLQLHKEEADLLLEILNDTSIYSKRTVKYIDLKAKYSMEWDHFEEWWHSETIEHLRGYGLILV